MQADTPLAGGIFRIKVTFPAEYPYKKMEVVIVTKMFHPNIGEGGNWNVCIPQLTVRDLARLIMTLMPTLPRSLIGARDVLKCYIEAAWWPRAQKKHWRQSPAAPAAAASYRHRGGYLRGNASGP